MHLLTHFFKFFLRQFGHTCLLELFKPSSDGFVTNKDSLADFAGGAWQVVNFGGDQNGSTTQA